MAVNGVNNLAALNKVSSFTLGNDKVKNDEAGVSFSDYLNTALNKVNEMEIDAEKIADDFAAGKTDNIHQVMIAAEKADLALQFTLQVRNKILDAYNEIMRIQI